MEFRPALPDSGISFVRCDLSPVSRIRARVDNRIDSPRRTTLAKHGHAVEMVEHILAALAGLQIDNCEVWVNAVEMPAWDGSSRAAVEALMAAGTVTQDAPRDVLRVEDCLRVGNEEAWIQAEPSRVPGLTLRYDLDFGAASPIGRQVLELRVGPQEFCREIASARTFILESEAASLRANGLAQRITYQDLLVFGPDGPIANPLRFPNECVRHKILDMIGDLALLEVDLQARIFAYRSGHQLNAELVRQLRGLSTAEVRRKSA